MRRRAILTAGLVACAIVGAAAAARAERADIPAGPVSSSRTKRACPTWATPEPGYAAKGAKCRVEWAWLDEGHRLSRVRYAWPGIMGGPRDGYHIEVLFEELPHDKAWALMGLAGNGIETYVTEFSLETYEGHLVVSVADCLDGTAGCPDRYDYEWHSGGRLVAVRSHVDEDVAARLRDGYELLGCEINHGTKRGATCFACRTGDERCCPGVELLVGLQYVSDVGLRLKAIREEDYDAPCDEPATKRRCPD